MVQALQMFLQQLDPGQQQSFLQQLSQLPPEARAEFVNRVLMQAMGGGGGAPPPQGMPQGPPPQGM